MPTQTPMARSSSSTRTPRGSACLNCRRRKLRCDSSRPVCGPCIRTHRECDCEYTDGPTRSRTQVLEEEIAILEARLHELEHPGAPPVQISLQETNLDSPSASSSSSAVNASPSGPILESGLPSAFRHSSGSPTNGGSWDCTDPPLQVVQLLVNYFLPHSSQLGFFLRQSRFLECVFTEDAVARTSLLPPALLNAVYLWAVRLSGNDALLAHESVFLMRAVNALSTSFSHLPPHNPLHILQAEVLLATYFFHCCRFFEGQRHCSAAVALAYSCRLNTLRGPPDPPIRTRLIDACEYVLPPPSGPAEEGERISAFWTVFMLDKGWAVALDMPSYMGTSTSTISTPWPLDMEDYESRHLPPTFPGFETVRGFLKEMPVVTADGTSPLALRPKAAALFEHATLLSSRYASTMTHVDTFFTEFFVLDNIIDSFVASLPPVEKSTSWSAARELLVVHTYARAATIQLYSNFKIAEGLEGSKALTAARAAVVLLDSVQLPEITFVDPIMAILWTVICRVLVREITRLRLSRTSTPDTKLERPDGDWMRFDDIMDGRWLRYSEAEEQQLLVALQTVISAMSAFSHMSELMVSQIGIVQREIEESI